MKNIFDDLKTVKFQGIDNSSVGELDAPLRHRMHKTVAVNTFSITSGQPLN